MRENSVYVAVINLYAVYCNSSVIQVFPRRRYKQETNLVQNILKKQNLLSRTPNPPSSSNHANQHTRSTHRKYPITDLRLLHSPPPLGLALPLHLHGSTPEYVVIAPIDVVHSFLIINSAPAPIRSYSAGIVFEPACTSRICECTFS